MLNSLLKISTITTSYHVDLIPGDVWLKLTLFGMNHFVKLIYRNSSVID